MNWDLTSYFPEFQGVEYKEFKENLSGGIKSLDEKASASEPLCGENLAFWKNVLLETERLISQYSHIRSYVGCLSASDSNREDYLREEAAISLLGSDLEKLEVQLQRALRGAEEDLLSEFVSFPDIESASYYVRRVWRNSRFTMSAPKEILASELGVDGISAWGRIYDTVSSKMTFEMAYPDGTKKRLPMSQRRSLMESPDREIRRAAFSGGNEAWGDFEDVAAGAINAISGIRHTLYRHREIDHFLDVALFDAAISRQTLDSMMEAIRETVELPRNILRLKAETLGLDGISWYDLGAPMNLGKTGGVDWSGAKSMVSDSFSAAYGRLGGFFDHICRSEWIDWEVREGKRPGGFCTGSLLTGESRIFMTYNGGVGDILTLAHEAGHAFHSHVMRELRPYAQFYPMTLAETASTFGEMLLAEGLLRDPSTSVEDKVLVRDAEINHGAIYLLDIPVRYEFERKLYERRAEGELTVSELKELMAETQKEIFGDVLLECDPFFWASKLHFYITGVSFYNFPYTFGYLLSRALFEKFRQHGEEFIPVYEEFLALTGSDDAEGAVKRSIGDDITNKDFWKEAIVTLSRPLEELKELLPSVAT
ncbi:MAG: M3 family oligoendopeptidase [Candidatus Dadabacteria bacterium]|nr:M3 family oligoendopeptidase [Candidatus Dadabacteria bacterium]